MAKRKQTMERARTKRKAEQKAKAAEKLRRKDAKASAKKPARGKA